MKKITKLLMVALAFVCVAGFSTTAEAKASKVTISNKKKVQTIYRDASDKAVELTYKVAGKMAAKNVTVTSSNKRVVAVKKGYTKTSATLVAKKAGKATITVKADKKKATVKVVVKQNVTKITAAVKKPVASAANVYTIQVGKKYTITKKLAGKPSVKTVTYKTSNKRVATVSKKGQISAKKPGVATITVTAKDKGKAKVSFKVVVTKKITKKTKSVKAEAEAATIKVGDTTTVKATVDAKATVQTVAFKSSDVKVATVDSTSGKVTGVAAGTVKITVYAIDGSKKKTTVEIVVKDEAKTVTFEKADYKAYVGEKVTVKAATNEDAFDTTVTYSIDAASQKIATVDAKTGEVTAVSRGTVDVVATSANGVTATAKVTVVDKTVTAIDPKDAKQVNVTVEFANKDLKATKADIEAALKASGLAAGKSKNVTINGVDYTAKYDGTTVKFNDKTIDEVVADKANISMTVGADLVKFVKALEVAQFAQKSYDYTVKVGGVEFKNFAVGTPYMTVVSGSTTYKAYVEAGVLYIVGDQSKDANVAKLAAEVGATATVKNN